MSKLTIRQVIGVLFLVVALSFPLASYAQTNSYLYQQLLNIGQILSGLQSRIFGLTGATRQLGATGADSGIISDFTIVGGSTASTGQSITFRSILAGQENAGDYWYRWDFGDGAYAAITSTPEINRTYNNAGTYNVNLRLYGKESWIPIDTTTKQLVITSNGGGGANDFDFNVLVGPAADPVTFPGLYGRYVAHVNLTNGTSQTVNFSLANLPNGVRGELAVGTSGAYASTASCQPGCNITIRLWVPPLTSDGRLALNAGTYPIRLNAISGNLTKSADINLLVDNWPAYADANLRTGGNVTVTRGSSVTNTVSANQALTLDTKTYAGINSLPSGVTASFSPNPMSCAGGNCTSTMTLNASASASLGSYPITVKAYGGSGLYFITFNLTVQQSSLPFNFSMASDGPFRTLGILPGKETHAQVSVNLLSGQVQQVNFSLSTTGLPSGLRVELSSPNVSQSQITGYYSSVSCQPNCFFFVRFWVPPLDHAGNHVVAPGSYTVNVNATGGGVTRTLPITVIVRDASSETFPRNLRTDGNKTVARGSSVTNRIYTTSNSTVNLTFSSGHPIIPLPQGVTTSFSPNPVSCSTACSSTITVNTTNNTPTGNHTIVVGVLGAAGISYVSFDLTVTAPDPEEQNNPVPTLSSVIPNETTAGANLSSVTLTGTNFIQDSMARLNGQNRTTTYISPTQLRMTLTTADIANPGTANVSVSNPAPGGGVSESRAFVVNQPTPSFDFNLSTIQNRAVTQGQSVTNTVSANLSSGTTQAASFTVSGLPQGTTAGFSPTVCNPTCSTTLTINTAATTPAGDSTVTVKATAGSLVKTNTFTLTVNPIVVVNPCANNQAPTANIAEGVFISATTNTPFTLDGSHSSDPDGQITTYRWTSGDLPIGTNSPTLTYSYPNIGGYRVALEVVDNCGRVNNNYAEIIVFVSAPQNNIDPTTGVTASGASSMTNAELKTRVEQLVQILNLLRQIAQLRGIQLSF